VSEPTIGEVVRRVDGLVQQVSNLVNKLDADRRRADEAYVNRGEYLEYKLRVEDRLTAQATGLTDINKDRDEDARWRRTAFFTAAVAAAGWLVTIALFIATLLGA